MIGIFVFKNGSSPKAVLSKEARNNLERKTDLVNIDRAVIAYSATNKGLYPTTANMNDAQFRAAHLPTLSAENINDPEGNKTEFAAVAAAGIYGYQAGPANCNNLKLKCTSFKLTAVLTDGSVITLP